MQKIAGESPLNDALQSIHCLLSHTSIMKRILTLSVTAALSFAPFTLIPAFAAPSGVNTFYDMLKLSSNPGLVEIKRSSLTVLEFPDAVQQVQSSRSELFELNVIDDNRFSLKAKANSGSTDLVVTTADGNIALFKVVITASKSAVSKRYVIQYPNSYYSDASADTSQTTTVRPPVKTTKAPEAKETKGNFLTSQTPDKPVDRVVVGVDYRAPTECLPLTASAELSASNKLSISFSFDNQCGSIAIIDPGQLTIRKNGQIIPFQVALNTTESAGKLSPGNSLFGVARINQPPAGELTLEWNVLETSKNTWYKYKKSLQVPVNKPLPASEPAQDEPDAGTDQ